MKGIMARAVAVVILGGLTTGVAFGGPPDPEPALTEASAPAPAPDPAPAPAPSPNQEKLEIFQLKITTELAKLDAIKLQESAKSQKQKDEVGVVMQMLDSIYSKLEDMLNAI